MLRRLVQTFLLFAAVILSSHAAVFDHAGWDALLKKHVVVLKAGQVTQVDYSGFKTDRAALRQYLSSASGVARPEFDQWSKQEQLAFLLNAYNAWTVELILSAYPDVSSIKDLGSLLQSPWKKRFIPLLGKTRSLDDIEHDLIRGSGRYQEPRVHFAANCASIGCPALRQEAYVAERLDAQLEDATQKFLSDRSRNRPEDDALKVSSIFKWYRGDFEQGWRGASSLGGFLALYREALGLPAETANSLAAGKMHIDFLPYDWRLNASSGKGRVP
ncbi:MAG: DUF547 domain-containing protein [Burkholderiales bacterium]|nr:DUF547 domain-containing protein [Burkholderiales bacterium]